MPRRILQGNVVSDKMDKTIVVNVERKFKHPIYKKFVKSNKKYHAHDENNVCKVGQEVRIIETKPMSKTKAWEVLLDTDVKSEKKASSVKVEEKKVEKKSADKAEK